MKFVSLVFFTAFAIAVDTLVIKAKIDEESMDFPLQSEPTIRNKRTLGVNEEITREFEIKRKDGSSVKISKSITYNDGGALTMLPAVLDSQTNNRIKLLNQIQNGRGRPELANSMINGANLGASLNDFNAGGDVFSADIEPSQAIRAASKNEDLTNYIHIGNIFNRPTTTAPTSISVDSGSNIDSGVAGDSHVSVNSTSPVVSNPITANPVVVHPVVVSPVSKPVVVNPVITDGVCCEQSTPGTTVPVTTVPVTVVAVNAGHSHGHGLFKKYLKKSVEYHHRKQAFKQYLLDKLAAKQQQTSGTVLVPVHHVHTPNCGHLNPIVDHQSKLRGLKELIAYKHELKVQRHRNKIAAIHAQLGQHGHHEQ